jgi:uncharacterized protein YifE (UPF0438 family)
LDLRPLKSSPRPRTAPITATDPRPFRFHCSTEVFPAEEVAVLVESGVLLEALAAGTVTPTTPEQVHFVRVDREEAEPETVAERGWVRLKGRREYEWDDNQKPAAEPRVEYGMVEFDADRCWW